MRYDASTRGNYSTYWLNTSGGLNIPVVQRLSQGRVKVPCPVSQLSLLHRDLHGIARANAPIKVKICRVFAAELINDNSQRRGRTKDAFAASCLWLRLRRHLNPVHCFLRPGNSAARQSISVDTRTQLTNRDLVSSAKHASSQATLKRHVLRYPEAYTPHEAVKPICLD